MGELKIEEMSLPALFDQARKIHLSASESGIDHGVLLSEVVGMTVWQKIDDGSNKPYICFDFLSRYSCCLLCPLRRCHWCCRISKKFLSQMVICFSVTKPLVTLLSEALCSSIVALCSKFCVHSLLLYI
ncbi:uncharacterized protein LOC114264497 isoform X2 [Camellia sinensis]|uniref:uncharacterized protein LOC114264497 isoform X2 n=1 Tax=Camellia sinensis TaxID=4442 RepID=UPI0010363987|nr:uncharacterized protein LOC114264497 isoform X2 [Camellia sinensis]